jgi:hypothetical protein
MKKSPIAKGRENAVKRVERALERERNAADHAMKAAELDYGQNSDRYTEARARRLQTVALLHVFSGMMREQLNAIRNYPTPDADTSAMAVKPPDSTKQTGMSTS